MGTPLESAGSDRAAFIDGVVGYLVSVDLNDAEQAEWWQPTAEGMAQLASAALTESERAELACRLLDEELDYSSPVVRDWAHLAALDIQP